jgi:hypothetical protein
MQDLLHRHDASRRGGAEQHHIVGIKQDRRYSASGLQMLQYAQLDGTSD